MTQRCQPMSNSPLPWRADKSGFILAPDGSREVQVAKVGDFFDKELLPFNRKRWEADRDLIVEAVNNYESLRAQLASARKALQFIADGYENHDVSHVDYRVKVYQASIAALKEIS